MAALTDAERVIGLTSVRAILATGGLVILSLRHGPGAASRPVIDVSVSRTIAAARSCGFTPVRERLAESVGVANRAAGVRWTWLAFALA